MLRTERIGCCLMLSAAVLAGEAIAQAPRSGPKEIIWQSVQNSKDIQIGILGEIGKPGVYRVDAESLSVQAIVRRAGGLTEDASQSIRIVRQERVAQSLFFSPQADSRLMPGDVLIVESKRALSAMSKVVEFGPRATPVRQAATSPADPTGVQVAYVNVLDSPVVVKLHLEDARLERVVQMLGQPIELAGEVKVIDPQKASHVVA
ncbi:MAG: SLBB domain-containing protein, partial [Candidatus Saccharimonas sp.]|nr:SLBB domain-containing protein [Planctomycetaceae bacterium]